MVFLLYVDDIFIVRNNIEEIEKLKKFLNEKFKLKDLGQLKYFIGLENARNEQGISLNRRHYALQLLKDTSFLASKPSSTPIDANVKLRKESGELLDDPAQYKRIIGQLLYLTITRPDLSYSVTYLNQFMSSPRIPHLNVVHWELQYVKNTVGQRPFFKAENPITIKAFADADWAAYP